MCRALAVVALLVCLCSCGPRKAASVRIDPALATLVPADTVLLAGVRVQELRATPTWKSIGADTLAAAFPGVDLRNAWEVLAVSSGAHTVFLARGKFSTSGMEPEVARPDATRSSYKGYTLIGIGGAALVFLNPTTAVAGQAEGVRWLLDARGSASGPPVPLAAEIAEIPPDTQIWVVGSGAAAALAPASGNLSNIGTALRLTEHFRFAADLRDGARLDAIALCRSDRDAESLAGALSGFLALARLGNPKLSNLSDAIHVARTARTVQVNGALPQATVADLLSLR